LSLNGSPSPWTAAKWEIPACYPGCGTTFVARIHELLTDGGSGKAPRSGRWGDALEQAEGAAMLGRRAPVSMQGRT